MNRRNHRTASTGSLPSDDEALRMALAFYCITEPEKRAQVLALAERLATDAQARGAINSDGRSRSLSLQSQQPDDAGTSVSREIREGRLVSKGHPSS